jgi:hypothetical protein
MKRVICNQCRTEAPQTSYGLAPNGWFTVSEMGNYGEVADYCSITCVQAAATAEMIKRDAAKRAADIEASEMALAGSSPAGVQ